MRRDRIKRLAALRGERHARGILKIRNRIQELGPLAFNQGRQLFRDQAFVIGRRRGKVSSVGLKRLNGRHIGWALGQDTVPRIQKNLPGQIERLLRSGRDENIFSAAIDPSFAGLYREALSQRGKALAGAVLQSSGAALAKDALGGVEYVIHGKKLRCRKTTGE